MSQPGTRHHVCAVDEIKQDGRRIATVKGLEIGVFAVGDTYYTWRNMCPHGGAPVCEGVVCGTRLPSLVYEYEYGKEREILRCPWHGWEFDLLTGKHLVDETVKLRGYKVEEEEGQLYLIV